MKLPSAEDLGQGPQLRSQGVVPIQLGRAEQGQIQAAEAGVREGQAIAGVGKTVFDIGQRIQEREDRNNYVTEKSKYLQGMVAAENEIGAEGDTDYKTYHVRLDEKLSKLKNDSASKIKNPNMRLQFEADTDIDRQQAIGRIGAKAWKMESSNGIAGMSQTIAQNRELFLNTSDEATRAAILDNSKSAIGMAKVNGYIMPEEAEEMGRKVAQDYAVGKINVLTPNDRIAALSRDGGLADLIPTDMKQTLIERAESENMANLRNMEWQQQQFREKLVNDNSLLLEQNRGNLAAIPLNEWMTMDKGQRDSLSDYALKLAEGNDIPTDWGTYYKLKTQAAEPSTRKAFEREDLTKYRTKLGTTEYKELIGAQASLREGKTDNKLLDGYLSKSQIVDGVLLGIGIDPTPKPGAQGQEVYNFRRMVDERVVARQALTGKEATNEEVRSIADQLIIEGEVPVDYWFDEKKHKFQLKPGETFVVDGKTAVAGSIKDVPADERKKIEAALKRNDRPINDQEILYRYNQKLGNGL